ncbi:MAG: hypothetical protein M3220_08230, partial [Chloroflexota bacterium]|nr:hypothetical protein [Chloroflexota bacterium]
STDRSSPTLTIEPSTTTVATEVIVVPLTATPLRPTRTVTATATETPLPLLARLRSENGLDANARHLTGGAAIIVDGNLNEWMGEPVPLVNPVYGRESWSGFDDLSGQARFAWNNECLYLAVERTDEEHYQPRELTGNELYRGDAVELWIDTKMADDDDESESNRILQDDFHFAFSAGDLRTFGAEGIVYSLGPNDSRNQLLEVASEPLPSGYTLETCIPWSLLSITPGENIALGYVVLLNDNDSPPSSEPQTVVASKELRLPRPLVSDNRERRLRGLLTFGDLILSP